MFEHLKGCRLCLDDALPEEWESLSKDLYASYPVVPEAPNCFPSANDRKFWGANSPVPSQGGRRWQYIYGIVNLDIYPGMEIADLGSGEISLQFYLAQNGCKVVGVDGSRQNLLIAKRRAEILELSKDDIAFYVQDIRNQLCEGKMFDALVSISVIEHLQKNTRMYAFQSMYNALRVGGKAVITIDFKVPGSKGYHPTIEQIKDMYEGAKKIGFNPVGINNPFEQDVIELPDNLMIYKKPECSLSWAGFIFEKI